MLDWGASFQFLNLVRQAGEWITGADEDWDTGESHLLDLGPQGYPCSLPSVDTPVLDSVQETSLRHEANTAFNERNSRWWEDLESTVFDDPFGTKPPPTPTFPLDKMSSTFWAGARRADEPARCPTCSGSLARSSARHRHRFARGSAPAADRSSP